MIETLNYSEIAAVDGAQLSAAQALTYLAIGAVAVGTGGSAALVGAILITLTLAVA